MYLNKVGTNVLISVSGKDSIAYPTLSIEPNTKQLIINGVRK